MIKGYAKVVSVDANKKETTGHPTKRIVRMGLINKKNHQVSFPPQ